MSRYINTNDEDPKNWEFWEIKTSGESVTRSFGKIGDRVFDRNEKFFRESEARAAARKHIDEKIKEGYKLIDYGDAGNHLAGNPELEAVIIKDRSNLENWAVYGDWLQSQDDVRGKIIALELSLKKSPKDRELKKLLEKHNRENMAACMDDVLLAGEAIGIKEGDRVELSWHHGFLSRAQLYDQSDYIGPTTEELVAALLHSSCSRFLRDLYISVALGGEGSYSGCVSLIAKSGPCIALRKLSIGESEQTQAWPLHSSWIGPADGLLKSLPNLEFLELCGNAKFDELRHTELKELHLVSAGLPGKTMAAAARADLPRLEKMQLWLGDKENGGSGEFSSLLPLFTNQQLPNLTYLGLQNSEFTNDILPFLAKAPLLKQLKTLDLSLGTMTDEGAQVLLDNPDAFNHLKRINLEENFLSESMLEQLKTAFSRRVESYEQRDLEDTGEYRIGRDE